MEKLKADPKKSPYHGNTEGYQLRDQADLISKQARIMLYHVTRMAREEKRYKQAVHKAKAQQIKVLDELCALVQDAPDSPGAYINGSNYNKYE